MDIGRIDGKPNTGSLDNSKNKAVDGAFEKHLQSALDQKDEKELKKVCKEFEQIIMNMMYKQMKATVPTSELIPGDAGRDIFESMLDDKLMEEASKNSGLGLADVLYKQLNKQLRSTYKPDKDK